MCKEIGVDPLSCMRKFNFFIMVIAKKGFWVDVLGVGDFYYELAVRLIVLHYFLDLNCEHLYCLEEEKRWIPRRERVPNAFIKDPWVQSTRSLSVRIYSSLILVLSKDLRKAVESLHKLGNEFKIIHTGQKRVICSVSIELSQDNLTIL